MKKNSSQRASTNRFWSRFAKTYWEQKPVSFKNSDPSIAAVDADCIFKLLVRYSDRCRKTKTAEGLKFYIDGESLFASQFLKLLPMAKDQSLQGYHLRMSARFPDYCLVCDELLQVFAEKWSALGQFMQGLYRETGMPNRYSEIGLYLGNYRKTPFGVHVDGCGVFSFPVVGTKRFRLWKPDFVEKNPELKGAFHYSPYKKHSALLTAKPGEVAYWPSSHWHIAESDGSFNATWSIGVWVDQPYLEVLSDVLKPLLAKKLLNRSQAKSISFRDLHSADGQITHLPEVIDQSISVLRGLKQEELHDCFLKFWLELASKNGFKNAPLPTQQTPLKRQDHVRALGTPALLWATLSSGELCLAVNGQLVQRPGLSTARELITKLNRGDSVQAQNQNEFEFLRTLYRIHGVVRRV